MLEHWRRVGSQDWKALESPFGQCLRPCTIDHNGHCSTISIRVLASSSQLENVRSIQEPNSRCTVHDVAIRVEHRKLVRRDLLAYASI